METHFIVRYEKPINLFCLGADDGILTETRSPMFLLRVFLLVITAIQLLGTPITYLSKERLPINYALF